MRRLEAETKNLKRMAALDNSMGPLFSVVDVVFFGGLGIFGLWALVKKVRWDGLTSGLETMSIEPISGLSAMMLIIVGVFIFFAAIWAGIEWEIRLDGRQKAFLYKFNFRRVSLGVSAVLLPAFPLLFVLASYWPFYDYGIQGTNLVLRHVWPMAESISSSDLVGTRVIQETKIRPDGVGIVFHRLEVRSRDGVWTSVETMDKEKVEEAQQRISGLLE